MKILYLYISTIFKLGISNVLYVSWYRFLIKIGLLKIFFKQRQFTCRNHFFLETNIKTDYPAEWKESLICDAEKILLGQVRYYAYHWKELGNPPNWFLNPFKGAEYSAIKKHWTELPDFHPYIGDIKNIWEASRFEWLVTLGRALAVTGDKKYLDTINSWLKNWTKCNPLNTGPNWKCGQEASIRLFNLLNTSFILNQHLKPSPALIEFVEASLQRIEKNIGYSIAQNNNHGTSEATALFIGGLWLHLIAPERYAKTNSYVKKGRHWLENRVRKLISESGSFSQHSVTYHRVVLDTLCFAELWRQILNDKSFSKLFYKKVQLAANWLHQLVDLKSGNSPNTGPNDGALLLNLHSCGYRDFRPSLQMASHLFFDDSWFSFDTYNEPLYWFAISCKQFVKSPAKKNLSAHGFTTINGDNTWALIKWPYYKFRPSHNDALHIDIWHNGNNILCDAGSYSYNPGDDFPYDLKSVNFHNTVCFDNQEQMPRLSRFLMARWLKADAVGFMKNGSKKMCSWSGSYTDSFGNRHHRQVELLNNQWIITDTLSGQFRIAVIGFNINSTIISCKDGVLSSPYFSFSVSEKAMFEFKDTIISNCYLDKQRIKRVELTVSIPGKYISKLILHT